MFVTCHPEHVEVARTNKVPAKVEAAYVGPERRSRDTWLTRAFDEIDFGILLLSAEAEVIYANRAASLELAGVHPLQITNQRVCTRDPRDAMRLGSALQEADTRGFRKLLVLAGEVQATVAVVPLACPRGIGGASIMLMLSRRDSAAPLAVEAFARGKGLTCAETRVLLALCNGKTPQQIAREASVEMSTVRSQIVSVRQKTGARDLRTLVAQVAALPPFVGVLAQTLGIHLDGDRPRLGARQALVST